MNSATGLAEVDHLVATLAALSGRPVPEALRRWRSRLLDAMVDSHYQFGGKKVAIALEADALKAMTRFLAGMGCDVRWRSPPPAPGGSTSCPAPDVRVGDLEDLEDARPGHGPPGRQLQRPAGRRRGWG